MARIALAPEVADDIERIFDHLAQHAPEAAPLRISEIIDAISVLETNPLIGRPVRRGKRALIVGRRSHGCVALYRYEPEVDTVFVLALRSQSEAGYRRV